MELLNANKKVIKSVVLYSPNGFSHGDFHLDDSLTQGNYILRGYTNYMKNAGDDFFFYKEFALLQRGAKGNSEPQVYSDSIDLQFFPEGGNLVDCGVVNRIAFKATGPDGRPIEVEGEIMDRSGRVVKSFKSEHDGLGMVAMLTSARETYKVHVTKPANVAKVYELPKVHEKGFVMQAYDAGSDVKVVVYSNYASAENAVPINLVAQARGKVCFAAKSTIAGSSVVFNMPKSKFPQGIGHITLFDGSGIPHCERLIYVNRNSNLALKITPDKNSYSKRGRVELVLDAAYSIGDPAMGDFSISVYDLDKVQPQDLYPLNMENYLQLTSDLKGYIHNPGYYFKDTLRQTKHHLDLLLMTQGWSRFKWQDVLSETLPSIKFSNEHGIPVSGRVQLPNPKKTVMAKIKILTGDGKFRLVESDSSGRFYSNDLVYFDSTQMMIQTQNAKGINHEFKFSYDPFYTAWPMRYDATRPDAIYAPHFLQQETKRRAVAKANEFTTGTTVLKAVEVTALKDDPAVKTHLRNAQVVDFTKIIGSYPTALHALQGRVGGLELRGVPPDVNLSIRGSGKIVYLLNGTMRVDADYINSLSFQDVESIEVLKGVAEGMRYGDGVDGVISVNLAKGGRGFIPSPGVHAFKYPGFYTAREFYSPKYDVPHDSHRLEDVRTTLYWNPRVRTDKNGKASVSFFASDVASRYAVVVEGISRDGYPGSKKALIQVE